jgi:hypothetical protein
MGLKKRVARTKFYKKKRSAKKACAIATPEPDCGACRDMPRNSEPGGCSMRRGTLEPARTYPAPVHPPNI